MNVENRFLYLSCRTQVSTLDFNKVLEERQNFDVAGHYSRPDIPRLTVNRKRQSTIDIVEDDETAGVFPA